MKKVFSIALGTAAFLMATAFTMQAILNWKIDAEKAQVKFVMQAHAQEMIGSFKGVKGDVKFDSSDLANSSFNCTVDIATINTGVEKRDGHLQGAGWFDAATHPSIVFTSTKIIPADTGYLAEGTLTAKGITKEVAIPFTFEGDKATGTFKGSFNIKRSDYGIGKTDAEVGDDITINLEVPVTSAD